VRTVILDEADEMLAMGFIEDIELILQELPEERQVGLFSATIPAPIARLSERYLRNPERVKIASDERNTPQIRQCYCEVNNSYKPEALLRILEMETPGPTIIFCRTKRDADELGELLRNRGLPADSLHGDLGQSERDRVMRRFREGRAGILVATDVAARGLDIEGVTHVINFDMPWDVESYTHRIGRTGRAGREGDAITLVTARERRQIRHIENITGARILRRNIPSLADIAYRRREQFKMSVAARLGEESLAEFRALAEELAENSDALDVATAALSLLWARDAGPGALLMGPETAPERETAPARENSERPREREREGREEPRRSSRNSGNYVKIFVEAGRQHGLRPGDLVGAIANEAGVPGESIGEIEILDRHSLVDVPEEDVERVVTALMKTTIRGRRPRVELFDPKRSSRPSSDRGGRPSPAMKPSRKRTDSSAPASKPARGRKGLVGGKD
jgi:ATP-dependent RNA helicase DeaD